MLQTAESLSAPLPSSPGWFRVSHKDGLVLMHDRGVVDGQITFFFKIFEGDSFEPIKHAHGHVLKILSGYGTIIIGSCKVSYKPGDELIILGDELHGFTDIWAETVVLEIITN